MAAEQPVVVAPRDEDRAREVAVGRGIEEASPLLRAALDGWAALEREACLT